MPRVRFLGRIFPRIELDIPTSRPFSCKLPHVDLEISSTVKIEKGIVSVVCDVNRFTYEDIPHILPQALQIAQTRVNLVAFARGDGIGVYLDAMTEPNGAEPTILLSRDFVLAAMCTAYTIEDHLDDFFELVMSDGSLALALSDLIQAVTAGMLIPINCARAIDAIRHFFLKESDTNRSQSWERMRDNLRVTDPYVRFITSHSKDHRHGNRIHITGDITVEISRRTWQIMNRFLVYRKLDDGPIPLDIFPILDG